MADEKKIVEVEVREKGLDELNQDLDQTAGNLREVNVEAEQTGANLEEMGKSGGLIATLDRLTGGLASQMRDLAEAAGSVGKNISGIAVAGGLTAVVTATALLVLYWDEITEFISGANERLEKQVTILETRAGIIEEELNLLQAQENLLTKQGKATDHLVEQRRTLLQQQIGLNGAQLASLQIQEQRLSLQAAELTFFDKLRLASGKTLFAKGVIGTKQEQEQALLEVRQRIAALKTAITEGQAALIPGSDDPDLAKGERVDPITGRTEGVILSDAEIITESIIGTAIARNARLQSEENKRGISQRQRDAAELKSIEDLEEAKAEARMMGAQESAFALMALGDLVGQQTSAGKTLATVGALINTYAAIAGQLKAFAGVPIPGYAIAQAIATAAVGFAAVRNIQQVQIPNTRVDSPYFQNPGVGSGGGAPSAPAIREPDFNIVGSSGVNQLADAIAEQEAEPQRAYVLSEDVENAAEFDRAVESSATIG